jgi:tRNA G37 N-methylase Trm5
MRVFCLSVAAILVMAVSSPVAQRLKPPDVRYVPTPQNVVEEMLEMAHVTAADVVYDLGSGDGRIPITAAQKYGARGVGIEIEPRLIREANENAIKAHVADRVWFVNQDLFETDLTPATVIAMYLHPRMLLQLMPKLKRLRPGTRIVSHYYHMGEEWPPDESKDINSLMIYLWIVR